MLWGSVIEEGGKEDGQAAMQVLWVKEGVLGLGWGRLAVLVLSHGSPSQAHVILLCPCSDSR